MTRNQKRERERETQNLEIVREAVDLGGQDVAGRRGGDRILTEQLLRGRLPPVVVGVDGRRRRFARLEAADLPLPAVPLVRHPQPAEAVALSSAAIAPSKFEWSEEGEY